MSKSEKCPLVTIITAAYNRADLIEETIKSILNQDYPSIEYIVIDDGSKDNTLAVVNKYKKQLRVYTQKNMGETRTVNGGFSLAKGDIIAVVSSDDPLLPHAVTEMVSYLTDHPDVLAVYPDWVMIDGEGKKIQQVHPADYDYLRMLSQHYCIPGPGTFFRKEAVKLTGGRSLQFRYIADFAFWLKLGMYGKLAHIPKPLATFRVHEGSQGIYAKGELMAAEHKKLVDWVYADPDLPKEVLSVKKQAYASAYFHAAKESISLSKRMRYYMLCLISDPVIFLKKLRYEAVKIKHRYQHF